MIKFLLVFGSIVSVCSLSYEPGKVYKYSYDTDVLLNEERSAKRTKAQSDVGFKLSATISLSPVWSQNEQQLVKIEFSEVKLHSVSREDVYKELNSIAKEPIYFEWNKGLVGQVFMPDSETTTALNIKKGVISLLQLQLENGERSEIDSAGDCTAYYMVNGDTVNKKKASCSNLDISKQFSHVNELLDVDTRRFSDTTYTIVDGIIHTASCLDGHKLSVNVRNSLGASIQVRQYLRFLELQNGGDLYTDTSVSEVLDKLKSTTGKSYFGMLAVTDIEEQQCLEDCFSTAKLISKYQDALSTENMATPESAQAFIKLLSSFRYTSKDKLLEILKNEDNYYIIPQLIDLAVAAQTSSAQEALMEFLKFDDEYEIELPERYLLSVAYSSHPDINLLKDLLKLFKKDVENENLRASIGLALGAVVRTFVKQNSHQYANDLFLEEDESLQLVEDIQRAYLEKLESCTEAPCKAILLRALGNTRFPNNLQIFLKYAEEGEEHTVSGTALKGLKALGGDYVSAEVKQVLSRIYHLTRRSYDSTIRTAALEILLANQPSYNEVLEIFLSLTNREEFETSKYVLEMITDAARWDSHLRATVKQVLTDTRLKNYDVLAPKGKSSALSNFLAETEDTNCTFGLYLENSNVGIMKKSNMNVFLQRRKQTMPLISFGLFARGLEAVAGSDASDDSGSDEVVTAGLALDLMDVSLRPVTFFEGQGGLMSAVWSAPSTPTSVLQGNLLLHDHTQRLHLQNGLIAELEILGCVSFDLSGSISISLWSRNSHSVVTNSGAMAIHGKVQIETSLFKTGLTFNAEAASKIDFTTDVDFYEMPFKMCLQMEQPPFTLRETISKIETAKAFKKQFKTNITRTRKLEGTSFSLSQRNSEQCKVLLVDQ